MSFACIYVSDFPVEAVVRAEPELRQCAVAVIDGTPPAVNVVAVNERARHAGVEAGMTKLQAQAILSAQQPEAHLRQRSPAQEAAAHAALLDCGCAFSPKVEDTSADTVLLDLAGLGRLFGPAARIARELARRASDMGLEVNVAVAANADAALHAARGFPGVTVIPPGKEAERLGALAVEVLAPAPEMLETLNRWGIRNLRALASLPGIAVSERLGQEGVRLQKLAQGEGARALNVAEPPLNFKEAMELEYPVSLLEPLAFILNRMLEQLCARLGARALATQELRLRMELDDSCEEESASPQREINRGTGKSGNREIGNPEPFASALSEITNCQLQIANRPMARWPDGPISSSCLRGDYERTLRLPVPMLDAKVFLKLLQLELKSNPPGAPVIKVWLAAAPVHPRATQGGLFLPLAPEPEKLELTLARLGRVAGPRRVGSPELLDAHRPERFQMKKFVPPEEKTNTRSFDSDRPSLRTKEKVHAITALRVFRPPLPALVDLQGGHPARVWASAEGNGTRIGGEVVWLAGPWRASGDWWSDAAWAREVWDVALKNGALYRLYRDAMSGEWFVEGSYD